MNRNHEHAGVIAPPPVLFLAGIASGFFLNRWTSWHALPSLPLIGTIVSAIGILLAGWSSITMTRAGTPVNPHRPVIRVVRHGPYRWSRNPIYVAMALVVFGIALATGDVWMVVTLVPVLVLVHYGVVLREEAYLGKKFGEPYQQYCQEVRRWI